MYTILGKKAGNRIFAYHMSHIDSDWDVWGPNFDSIIGLASLGIEISNRVQSLSDESIVSGPNVSKELRPVAVEVETIVRVLHQLPEALQNHQGISSVGFESISAMLSNIRELLKEINIFAERLQANMRGDRLKQYSARLRLPNQVALLSKKLADWNKHFSMFLQSVVTMQDQVLSKTRTFYIRLMLITRISGANIEAREQLEQSDTLPISSYTTGLSKRQTEYLGKMTFSPGKNFYVRLQHPLASARITTDGTFQAQERDRAPLDSLPFLEIKDEEAEPLISSAQSGDQLRLLLVFRASHYTSELKMI